MKRFLATILAVVLPVAAQACAVCGANGKSQSNFLVPTIFLSLLPLAMVFGGLMWLKHRAGEVAGGERAGRDAIVPPSPSPEAGGAPLLNPSGGHSRP